MKKNNKPAEIQESIVDSEPETVQPYAEPEVVADIDVEPVPTPVDEIADVDEEPVEQDPPQQPSIQTIKTKKRIRVRKKAVKKLSTAILCANPIINRFA